MPTDELANQPPHSSAKILVLEERAVIHRDVVESGRVRISKTVHEHQEEVDVILRHEEVQVQRVAVNEFVADGVAPPTPRYEGSTLIVPVVREIVMKRLLIVEELHILKQQVETHETETVTLRREEVHVERHPTTEADTPSTDQ
ncbi:YsnF/AvaK domain-containing protein [Hymenobacter aerilatus]|uniref:YsnF/AvaK domain-containing protein n=1 Tax=Hymenobacter aerilatus TaxID=2932251 RepID=A0A8T9SZV5_9BACT|nr:YsnF/AvaK domain-containing protein [Hymenobacter aerilatus]UOR06474.1 YsnF/AvaK domain-containing protein [Hymenobacter aerilatus]